MTPSEIEKCPGHPLNTSMYLATLDEIYKIKDPDAEIPEWEGSVAEHIEWTVSDGAEEVANGLMDVFPRAVHTIIWALPGIRQDLRWAPMAL